MRVMYGIRMIRANINLSDVKNIIGFRVVDIVRCTHFRMKLMKYFSLSGGKRFNACSFTMFDVVLDFQSNPDQINIQGTDVKKF